jgi:hypothetical protein
MEILPKNPGVLTCAARELGWTSHVELRDGLKRIRAGL